jgi:hypothetical protein
MSRHQGAIATGARPTVNPFLRAILYLAYSRHEVSTEARPIARVERHPAYVLHETEILPKSFLVQHMSGEPASGNADSDG